MVLFMVRDIVKGCIVIFLIIVLRVIVSWAIESILGYITIVFSYIIILVVFKVLCNIVIIIE